MTNSLNPKVITIMGPTASGKTSLAIDLAKQINGEVVSVDSALVYKDMNIGTAKPSYEERAGITHHLIDIVTPEHAYSVGDFVKDCDAAIKNIIEKNRVPILAGGTMMYFNAIVNGLNELPPSDENVRLEISAFIEEHGLEKAHTRLSEIDPTSAARVHPNDTQRITRALEVFYSSGKTLSEQQSAKKHVLPYRFSQYVIMPKERTFLHKLIEKRFDLMLQHGLIEEVSKLVENYSLNLDMPSMRSVGYRQVFQHILGEMSQDEMRERAIIATRQLAKRQCTWLRGWENATFLDSCMEQKVDVILQNIGATD